MGFFFICFAVLSFATSCVLVMECAPHKDVSDINEQLREQGFATLASEDDFTKTVKCTLCGWKITYKDHAKAVWLIKRHSNENSHKVKAGWFLNTDNKVLASKPKGKLVLLIQYFSRVFLFLAYIATNLDVQLFRIICPNMTTIKHYPTCLSSSFKAFAVLCMTDCSGIPLDDTKTVSNVDS